MASLSLCTVVLEYNYQADPALALVCIPTKAATDSDVKPATCSDAKRPGRVLGCQSPAGHMSAGRFRVYLHVQGAFFWKPLGSQGQRPSEGLGLLPEPPHLSQDTAADSGQGFPRSGRAERDP